MSRLITFASTLDHLTIAKQIGVDEVVLEDSKLAIRSYTDEFSRSDFSKLTKMADAAKGLTVSAVCDVMIHDRHIPLLHSFIATLKAATITRIRIQDVGLISFFNQYYPEAHLILNMEIGNHNQRGLDYYGTHVHTQVLSNELAYTELQTICGHSQGQLELQVHGPVLIQYSNRRYLSAISQPDSDVESAPVIAHKTIEDADYKGRYFPVLDNPHGHFMYFFMDRCLLSQLDKLDSLNLYGWIIDTRGQSLDYFEACLRAYKDRLSVKTLQPLSERPLKPIFFLANNTDQDRPSVTQRLPDGYEAVGRVLDVIKGKMITIELIKPLVLDSEPVLVMPDGKVRFYASIPEMTIIDDHLIQLPWIKSANAGGVLAIRH